MPMTAINEGGSGAVTIPATSPVVMLGPPSPSVDPLASTISAGADLLANAQDRMASERAFKKAEADRIRATADAQHTAAQMRASIMAFGTGGTPAWFPPLIVAIAGGVGLYLFVNRRKTRRR